MNINFTKIFISDLDKQTQYNSLVKPVATKKFKKDLIRNLKGFKISVPLQNQYISTINLLEIMYSKITPLFTK